MAFDIKDLGGLGSAFDFGGKVIDKIWPPQADPELKLKATTDLAAALEAREERRDSYKRDIIVAELQQSDLFTKRARPSVIYCGLIFIGLNYVVAPFIIDILQTCLILGVGDITADQVKQLKELGSYQLPGQFWLAWTGICSVYSWGRSQEKKGKSENEIMNKVVSMITGGKK